jgi:hydrophobe/amphiphile efflux-1 (HAE1) family protein
MAVNVSAWAIRQPLPSIVIMAVLVVIGYAGFKQMPITRMPNIDTPVISVVVMQFGASPVDIEKQISKKVEDAVAGVDGAHHIITSITDGISSTIIQFRFGTDTDRALNDVKDAITRMRADLPQGIGEPMVRRVDVVGLPILTYAASAAAMTPERLSWFVEDVVVRRLQGLPGVASIDRIGTVQREVRVGLNPAALQAVGITAVDVSHQLLKSNADFAGGRSEIGGREQSIRTLAQARTFEGLEATRITLPAGGDIRLGDIASVTDGIAEPSTFARSDGSPVVGFSILRAKGASDVEVAKLVKAEIDRIKDEYQKDNVKIELIDTSVTHTLGNYHAAMETLFEGSVLAIVVVFLFLRDWRATVIAGLTLPLSILPSFWIMNALGFSLNFFTTMAIVLSTGILVDDAIVEIENIIRHIRMGKSPYQAALEAADEIGLAVIAISLTIVAVFLPVGFMKSVPGQFFKQFGVTVSIQVLFSLLCARLITPMLAAYFLKPHQHEEKADGRIMRLYTHLVIWSVRHRFITVALGLMVFAAAMAAATRLPQVFLPQQDTGRSTLAIELPPGSRLSDTQALTDVIWDRLRTRPEIKTIFVNGGKIPPSTQDVRKAALTITYASNRRLTQQQLEEEISRDLADIPDFHFWFLDDNGQRPVILVVTGPDVERVSNFALDLTAQMSKLPQLANVVSTTSLNRTELQIRPYRDLVTRYGVFNESLGETIRVATMGDVGPALAQYDVRDRVVPIRVLLEEGARRDLEALKQLRVPSMAARGMSVPLSALADVHFGEGLSGIQRYDRKRKAEISADLANGVAVSEALNAVQKLPIMQRLPEGVNVVKTQEAELQEETLEGFSETMSMGMAMVYALLAVLFGSLLHPLTVLLSLPLSIVGVIIALFVAHLPIGIPVLIGILLLMGIVSKNAIMLVDFAVDAIHRGVERNEAVIDAGRKRARPIVMTTIAMIGGMTPSALGIGAGGDLRAPMAIAVIGGLAVATLLSLLFVPAVFTIMQSFGDFGWRLFQHFIGKADEPEPHHAPSIAMKNAHDGLTAPKTPPAGAGDLPASAHRA